MDKVKKIIIANRKGFTLLELMSVLVIMGVLVSAGIKKYDLLTGTASETAIEAGVRELNLQETMIWTKMKFSDTGWISDAEVYKAVDKNLGQGYSWNPGPSIGGGTLHYQSQSIVLVRKESQINSIGNWY